MKKVGSYLKDERVVGGFSLHQLEEETKIKREFIDNIEKEEWDKLPEYPVVLGFVKTLAKHLDLPETTAAAMLRRDYPVEKSRLRVNPKPDVIIKSGVNPKLVTIIFSIFTILCALGYLFYQYSLYISPPNLEVFQPEENQIVEVGNIIVSGKTSLNSTLSVNNQRIIVKESGEFMDKISVDENTTKVTFIAKSRYGKEKVIERSILPKQK